MEGIIVEIPDHPKTGQKIKVEVKGFSFDWDTEEVNVRTEIRYYENVGGSYGDLVVEPTKIVFSRSLVASTTKDQFVDSRTGQDLVRKFRDVQVESGEYEPIPVEEQVPDGPTERPIMETVSEEYWVYKSDDITEVPLEFVIRMFNFFEALVSNSAIIVKNLLISYVQAEIAYGTFYQEGR